MFIITVTIGGYCNVRLLMKLGHNDHLVARINFLLENGLTPRGLRGGANSAKSSDDFSSETTGQV